MTFSRHRTLRALALGTSAMVLVACGDRFDMDLRSSDSGFSTTEAAREPTGPRPEPDDRGVISYPNYQIAVAQSGDTVDSVANRLGIDGAQLASRNALDRDMSLRSGEVLVLPERVSEPSPETGADRTGPIRPTDSDIGTIATTALDRADAETDAPSGTGREPTQHRVQSGETAQSIAARYGVSLQALADWNGLDEDLTLREGQALIIPVSTRTDTPSAPGEGSPTPEPPDTTPEEREAAQAQPEPEPEPQAEPEPDPEPAPEPEPQEETVETPESPDLGAERSSGDGSFAMPVSGTIIRDYAAGSNDGIDIGADAGTTVRASADGTVAAVTEDTDEVPILVVEHEDDYLTVYANIANIAVARGDTVSQGDPIASVRDSDPPFMHFEIRRGFDSVDPAPYLQ